LNLLVYNLNKAHYQVMTAVNGRQALEIALLAEPDLILLDLMLPEIDGLDVCRELRRESSMPIIMLTARVEETDKIIGLEMGADDYMTKPFSPRELVARVRTVLRRGTGNPQAEVIHAGDLTLDRGHYSARFSDREIPLTPTEFELLATLASQPGRIFSRAQLLTAVRGVAFESYERAIDSHIRNLRRKIEPVDGSTSHIITVHGAGYKYVEAGG